MLEPEVIGQGRFPLKHKPQTLKEQIQELLRGDSVTSEELRKDIETVKTSIHSLSREQKKSLQTHLENSTGLRIDQVASLSTEQLLGHLQAALNVVQPRIVPAKEDAPDLRLTPYENEIKQLIRNVVDQTPEFKFLSDYDSVRIK